MKALSTTEAAARARAVDKGWFSYAALRFAEETGSVIEDDIAVILAGYGDADTLLAACLYGAEPDRVQGARDYAAAVAACAERAR
jgi:hypothetical protein